MTASPAPHSFILNAPTPARLIRATAASWTKEREAEAIERGYRVTYAEDAYGQTVASFWNGPYLCFTREWTP